MAKKQSSKSKAETLAAPPATSEMPAFSADALTKLAERIQSGFDDAKKPKNFGKQREATNGGKRNQKEQGTNEPTKENLKVHAKKPHGQSKKTKQKAKPAEISDVPRGKKRARGADVPKPVRTLEELDCTRSELVEKDRVLKDTEKPNPKLPQPANKTKDGLPRKPGEKGGIDKERLLKEIIELGGTQEDLDLVDGIDSDEDEDEIVFAESGKMGKGLQKELRGFLKEIGLEAGKFSTVEDGCEDEDEEWVDDDSGDDAETKDEDEGRGMGGAEELNSLVPTIKPLKTKPDLKLKGSKLAS